MKIELHFAFALFMSSIAYGKLGFAMDDSTRAAARSLVNEGAAEYTAGKYDAALKKFNEALEVAKVPTVAVWAAQANEKLGKWVRASELYEQALLMQPNELWVGTAQEDARLTARKSLDELKPRIPTIRIQLTGANTEEAEVSIDSIRVPNSLLSQERPVDPGTHVIVAKRGKQTTTRTLELAAAQKQVVSLQVTAAVLDQRNGSPNAPAPSEPESPGKAHAPWQRTAGWVGVGVGATGIAFGTVTGILTGLKRSSLQGDGCSGNTCVGSSYSDRVSAYNTLRTLSTVGFIVGGIGAAAGVTLLLTSPKSEASPRVSLTLGSEAIQLMGDF